MRKKNNIETSKKHLTRRSAENSKNGYLRVRHLKPYHDPKRFWAWLGKGISSYGKGIELIPGLWARV